MRLIAAPMRPCESIGGEFKEFIFPPRFAVAPSTVFSLALRQLSSPVPPPPRGQASHQVSQARRAVERSLPASAAQQSPQPSLALQSQAQAPQPSLPPPNRPACSP